MRFGSIAVAALIVCGPYKNADACGGLFCNGTDPIQVVVQSGESIVFSVDRPAGTVTAIINIRYQGGAREFAWLLPLQSAPTELGVSPSGTFTVIDRLTAPRFEVTTERRGICSTAIEFGGSDDLAFSRGGEPGVEVLQRGTVGPYESVVLEGRDTDAVRRWLTEANYVVTDQMMQVVTPYLSQGDVLLALRLQKDRDTGDIQPVRVTMTGNEVCVPIRLTAIAAQEDMDLTALVLSKEGRAIPENYFHVGLNLAKIDWINTGANYRQLMANAADEGSGNAFTTEFAGSARIFDGTIAPWSDADREALEQFTNAADLIGELDRRKFFDNTEVASILIEAISTAPGSRISAEELAPDPRFVAFRLTDLQLDPRPILAQIWERVVIPGRATQQLFDGAGYATRLYTLISPEEMNLDPVFDFRSDLPDVSNVHKAKAILDCGLGGRPRDAKLTIVIEETGQELHLENSGYTPQQQAIIDNMPAATHVEQLFKRETIKDNRDAIASALSKVNGCSCNTQHGTSGFTGLALIGAVLLLRRRR